jgi:anaerobic dimethyl sulfoxide reductase subunit B (iron-sulfur subunit)
MQLGFYFDQTRCTGCGTCIVACKDWNDVPAGPESWMRIITIEKGDRHDLFVARMISPCYHCATPLCASVCPAGVIVKRKDDGIVWVDRELCLGGDACGRCRLACPYHAPQFPAGENAGMRKCDLCLDRWTQNQRPICVMACPTRALDAGPIEELRGKAGSAREAEGFVYSDEVAPSILFKAKKDPAGYPGKRSRVCTIPPPADTRAVSSTTGAK